MASESTIPGEARPDDSTSAPPQALSKSKRRMALVPTGDTMLDAIKQFASDPNVSIDKVERIVILLQERETQQKLEFFNQSMAVAQNEMRPIEADLENTQTRSRYASYAQLDKALRPIYTKHGFALSFDTQPGSPENPLAENHIRVVCFCSHNEGYTRTYHLDMPADGKGAKGGDVMTKTHATGSAVTYAQRYLLKMIFNVAVGEDDDDGNQAGTQPGGPEVSRPRDYEDKLDDLRAAAQEGYEVLGKAWAGLRETRPDISQYMAAVESERAKWGRIKQTAMDVDKKRRGKP